MERGAHAAGLRSQILKGRQRKRRQEDKFGDAVLDHAADS